MRMLNRLRHALKARMGASPTSEFEISAGHKILDDESLAERNGWRDMIVAERQHRAYIPLLEQVHAGQPRLDFAVAAQAVGATGLTSPFMIEIGCGSGYYNEALNALLDQPLRYLGLDRSESMTSLARRVYPRVPFVTGDACQLPLADDCCDISFNGTSLMHIADYVSAIAEGVRVSRDWCIFHTVPVVENRSTTLLSKEAYGREVIEVIFNRSEIEKIFGEHGLAIEAVFESFPYDVSAVMEEPTWTLTYVCRKK